VRRFAYIGLVAVILFCIFDVIAVSRSVRLSGEIVSIAQRSGFVGRDLTYVVVRYTASDNVEREREISYMPRRGMSVPIARVGNRVELVHSPSRPDKVSLRIARMRDRIDAFALIAGCLFVIAYLFFSGRRVNSR
jgi:Protein of unknown function (DUF3592)